MKVLFFPIKEFQNVNIFVHISRAVLAGFYEYYDDKQKEIPGGCPHS